jgi:hypothetical protein
MAEAVIATDFGGPEVLSLIEVMRRALATGHTHGKIALAP